MPDRARIDGPNRYDGVADIYDAYVRADFDLRFFADEAFRASGAILELMAGTGRVTKHLVRAGHRVIGIDCSLPMLRRLRMQVREASKPPMPICADASHLPLRSGFGLVVVPFNSFAEIVSPAARLGVLADIERVLAPNGRCILTLHNPARRVEAMGDGPRTLGPVALPDGTQLRITIEEQVDHTSRTVTATQQFEAAGQDGKPRWHRTQVVRFALVEREEVEENARKSGLEITVLYGDYDRSPFDRRTSPYMIWTLTKPAGTRSPLAPFSMGTPRGREPAR